MRPQARGGRTPGAPGPVAGRRLAVGGAHAAHQPPAGSDRSTRAVAGLALMVVLWAVNFSFIKVGLREFPALAYNALRFPLASLALYLLLRAGGPIPRPQGADRWRLLALGILGNTVYQLCFIAGMEHAHAGIAALLLSGTPVMTALLSAALGHERVGRSVWAAVGATFAGMMLVALGGRGPAAGGAPIWANLLMLVASGAWAVYTVGCGRLVDRYGSVAVTAWTLWAGTIGIVLLGLPELLRASLAHVSPLAWASVAYGGVLSIAVGYSLWYYGVRHVGNTRTAVINNLVPVVALGVAWLWLREVPTGPQLAGAAVIIGGVTLAKRAG